MASCNLTPAYQACYLPSIQLGVFPAHLRNGKRLQKLEKLVFVRHLLVVLHITMQSCCVMMLCTMMQLHLIGGQALPAHPQIITVSLTAL